MAPRGEAIGSFMVKARRPSNDGLKRTTSDISFELLTKESDATLAPVPEIEDARCECCGMVEEYTLDYIGKVRDKYRGKWICGLCTEAVEEGKEKNGGKREAALEAHMNACSRFNKFGRAYPVLSQAEAMREMFRKCMSLNGRKMNDIKKKGQIARTSSCIPALNSREINDFRLAK